MLKNLCESVGWRIIPSEALERTVQSEARNFALEAKDLRDSSSSANKNGGLLGMTGGAGFSASC
jgi:hypothetical protein